MGDFISGTTDISILLFLFTFAQCLCLWRVEECKQRETPC